jgi:hypothetical protein
MRDSPSVLRELCMPTACGSISYYNVIGHRYRIRDHSDCGAEFGTP